MIDTKVAQPGSWPVLYEPVDKDGIAVYGRYTSAQAAAEKARMMWPRQEQDEDRTGKGWDVQVVAS